MNRPDVAILLDHFGSGGVERVACHVANGLQRRGFNVAMVVLHDGGPSRDLLDQAVSVHALDRHDERPRGERMKAALPAIAAYLQECEPRLLHAPGNHLIRPSARAIALANYRGRFLVKLTNPLGGADLAWRARRKRRRAFRDALRRSDRVLVLSENGYRDVAKVGRGLVGKARVIHNPYVSEAMLRAASERRPTSPPVILSVGRLSEQKNQAMLLRAAARLGERPWRLRLCGTGPDEPALRALAKDLGIADRCEFAGFLPDPLPEYLAATVLALSSRWEGLPATMVEAMACGCPVVATRSSEAVADLLAQAGACSPVEIDDEEGFASLLGDAIDGCLPQLRSGIVASFGMEASCDEHAAVIAELLDQGGQRIAG